jgi:uncharacterized protein (DUF1015 family)
MLNISPLKKALIPKNKQAADDISGPNYDEFQSDEEIYELITEQPDVILKVTMAHCDVESPQEIMQEGSEEFLQKASENMQELVGSDKTAVKEDVLYVYEMEDAIRDDVRQIGLGCMAKTGEIRTKDNPEGTIIRNEGVREKKARKRADLVEKTSSYIGTVNCGIDDKTGKIAKKLEDYADSREADYAVVDQKDNVHKIWIIEEKDVIEEFVDLFAKEPRAYVADGNHRSAAALMLGLEDFLTVFFIAGRMRIDPYHRLIEDLGMEEEEFMSALKKDFEIEKVDDDEAYQPEKIHNMGLYLSGEWYHLKAKDSAYDASNAVQSIDADIVQRTIFDAILGIENAKDHNFTYVGGDRGVEYLQQKVDSGEFDFAISMAPVTMEQFIEVCEQNKFMPPKSTWFEPKIRSGLVIELL